METGKHFYIKHVKCAGCGKHRTYDGDGLRMSFAPKANWKLLLACSVSCAEKFVKKPEPVCKTCNDTHRMEFGESASVMCTQCPLPCTNCEDDITGAYCLKAPCSCSCHALAEREKEKQIDTTEKPAMLMTKKGPVAYREITQTHETT